VSVQSSTAPLPHSHRGLIVWWAVFSVVYGCCVLTVGALHDAGLLALLGLFVTVPSIGLLTAIDIVARQLPRVISYTAALLALPLLTLEPRIEGDGRWSAVNGSLLMLLIAAAVRVIGRGEFGRGDLHFAPLLGTVAGWFNISLVFTTWIVTAVLGGVIGLVHLLRRKNRRFRFPYGPIMVLGLCFAIVMGWR
jgi:leader peptidase (prepilin peptidase)/N-methyltransferase